MRESEVVLRRRRHSALLDRGQDKAQPQGLPRLREGLYCSCRWLHAGSQPGVRRGSGPVPLSRDWNWSRFLSSCFPVHRALSFTVHARMKNYPQRTFTAPSTVDNAQGEQRNTASGGNKKRLGHTSKKRDHALTASRTALSPETAMASLKAAPAHQLPAQPRNVHKLIEGSLVGATLHSVDGTGHLVRAIVPQPARVTQAHRRVARLLGRETDLIVGGGVPQLPTSSTRKRQVAMQRHARSQPSSSPGEPKSTASLPSVTSMSPCRFSKPLGRTLCLAKTLAPSDQAGSINQLAACLHRRRSPGPGAQAPDPQ